MSELEQEYRMSVLIRTGLAAVVGQLAPPFTTVQSLPITASGGSAHADTSRNDKGLQLRLFWA